MKLEHGMMKMFDKGQNLVMKTPLSTNRTFKVNLEVADLHCLTAKVDDEAWLWYYRYGHLNFGSLQKLGKEGIVSGLPEIKLPRKMCEGCLVGKQSRNAFKSSCPPRAREPLEVVPVSDQN
ncbi:GAG-pre-integrase domain [Sesbania bispinosa]|nr:GAG-pre-integrase domain [Sesbania bispinosa]